MEKHAYVLLQRSEYDIASAAALESELRMLESGSAFIDMARVSYMDSNSLAVLIATRNRLRARDERSKVTLLNVSPHMRRLLQGAGVTQMFVIE